MALHFSVNVPSTSAVHVVGMCAWSSVSYSFCMCAHYSLCYTITACPGSLSVHVCFFLSVSTCVLIHLTHISSYFNFDCSVLIGSGPMHWQ